MRQRDILLKKSKSIADANVHLNQERTADAQRMTSENSTLISELNALRVEKKSYQRRVKELEAQVLFSDDRSQSPKRRVQKVCETPYVRRKQTGQEQLYRLEHKRMENTLPPRMPRPDRGGMERPEYVKKPPPNMDVENLPLQKADEIYTGGPIAPDNSIPKMRPQASLSRR